MCGLLRFTCSFGPRCSCFADALWVNKCFGWGGRREDGSEAPVLLVRWTTKGKYQTVFRHDQFLSTCQQHRWSHRVRPSWKWTETWTRSLVRPRWQGTRSCRCWRTRRSRRFARHGRRSHVFALLGHSCKSVQCKCKTSMQKQCEYR